ncbi:MAG: hypothetical protein KY464_01485 [Gemmatimonadetes bacterium]|nr:hypothetical protein [Gemmatimonadota bacterium]
MPTRRLCLLPLACTALTAAIFVSCAPAAVESPVGAAANPIAAAAAPIQPALTAAQREPYLGSYSITTPEGERITFRVFEENGMLKGQPAAQEALQLIHQGGDTFRTEGQYQYVVTFAIENNRATSFTARNPSGVLQGVRIP